MIICFWQSNPMVTEVCCSAALSQSYDGLYQTSYIHFQSWTQDGVNAVNILAAVGLIKASLSLSLPDAKLVGDSHWKDSAQVILR